jgi:hypothetical protein
MHQEVESLRSLEGVLRGDVPQVLASNAHEFKAGTARLYMVTEFVPGDTLQELVRRSGHLTLDQAVAVTREFARIMAEAHRVGVLHRDLKPANIIVRQDNPVKLEIVDFGISFHRESESEPTTRPDEQFRNQFYDVPEKLAGGSNRHDERIDIADTVAVLYYCLTGHAPQVPVDGEGRKPQRRPGRMLSDTMEMNSVVGQLNLLMDIGFSPAADDRFQSFDELLLRLDGALSGKTDIAPVGIAEVARLSAQKIRRSNRPTQLREMKPIGEVAVATIKKHVGTLSSVIAQDGMFTISYGGNTAGKAGFRSTELPDGFDTVEEVGIGCQLRVPGHHTFRECMFRVASKGMQCVVMRRWGVSDNQQKVKSMGEWEPVTWFSTQDSIDHAALTGALEQWADHSMRGLASEMSPEETR